MSFGIGSAALPVNAGATGTLKNEGPDTLYYRSVLPVDATSNDGSLASGTTAVLTGTQYLASAGLSNVNLLSDGIDPLLSHGAYSFEATLTHSTEAITGALVTNLGPNTLYYRDRDPVTATVNDGSIASGAAVTLAGVQYFSSNLRTWVSVAATSVQTGSYVYLDDLFDGTLATELSAHAPDIGTGTWVETNAGSQQLSGDSFLYRTAAPVPNLFSVAVPTADYQIDAVIKAKSILASDVVIIYARMISPNRGYDTFISQQGQITGRVDASTTLFGPSSQSLIAGSTHTLSVKVQGSTITYLYDGAQVGSVVDTAYAGAGKVGVKVGGSATTAQTSSTGLQLDRVTVTTL